jgi:hypothetical protein
LISPNQETHLLEAEEEEEEEEASVAVVNKFNNFKYANYNLLLLRTY